MLASDVDLTISDLIRDEALALKVYDDANSQPIVPGTVVIGHPTIGIGRALDLAGLRHTEVIVMCRGDIAQYLTELAGQPWFAQLDANRQRAILNMRHTLGLAGLMAFRQMIAALAAKDMTGAAAAVLHSRWADQARARANRVADLIATGHDGHSG